MFTMANNITVILIKYVYFKKIFIKVTVIQIDLIGRKKTKIHQIN